MNNFFQIGDYRFKIENILEYNLRNLGQKKVIVSGYNENYSENSNKTTFSYTGHIDENSTIKRSCFSINDNRIDKFSTISPKLTTQNKNSMSKVHKAFNNDEIEEKEIDDYLSILFQSGIIKFTEHKKLLSKKMNKKFLYVWEIGKRIKIEDYYYYSVASLNIDDDIYHLCYLMDETMHRKYSDKTTLFTYINNGLFSGNISLFDFYLIKDESKKFSMKIDISDNGKVKQHIFSNPNYTNDYLKKKINELDELLRIKTT